MQANDPNAPLLRLYYLQQLGITSYVPRAPLPGALAVELEMLAAPAPAPHVEEAAAATVSMPAPAVQEAATADMPVVRPAVLLPADDDAMASEAPKALRRNADPAVAAVPPPTTPAEPAAALQIQLLVLGNALAVAIQIPAAMPAALREVDARLLANLLRWLGVAWPPEAQPLLFRWPLPGMPPGTAAQLDGALQAFLHQAALEQPFGHLLVLGGELRLPAGASQGWQAWPIAGLAEMLALPALKLDAWRALLPLKAQLAS